MLAGQREVRGELSRSRHIFLPKLKGVTLVEVLIVTAVMSTIFASLFYVLTQGYLSNEIGLAKLKLQEEARRAIEVIGKDVRQTTVSEIKSNNPSSSHLKFRIYQDYSEGNPQWSSNYIEYTYDANSYKLQRTDYNSNITTYFYNIASPPFDVEELINNNENKISIDLNMQETVKSSLPINFSLTGEITIRNE